MENFPSEEKINHDWFFDCNFFHQKINHDWFFPSFLMVILARITIKKSIKNDGNFFSIIFDWFFHRRDGNFFHQKINQKWWKKITIKKSIKNDGNFFHRFFLIDFVDRFFIEVLLIFFLILIDFSICLCCVACVFHCCIDVSADRNGSTYKQNKLNAGLELNKKNNDGLASLS